MVGFNSAQYSWSDVTIQLGDRVLTGIQSVRYAEKQEKGFVYGKGNMPLSVQRGNYSYEGSVKLLQNEVETLIAGAPEKKLARLRDLTVTIAFEREDGESVTDNLVGVEFMDIEKALEQGKLFMEVDLPIIFLGIKNAV